MDSEIRELERAAALGDERAKVKLESLKARTVPCDRWFYRCTDCLSVIALDLPRKEGALGAVLHPDLKPTCVCEGNYKIMGRVERGDLVDDKILCACDERCTSAQGPLCECLCGSKNHGSRRVVKVTKTVGGVPRLSPHNVEKAMVWAKEFREAREAAQKALNEHPGVSILHNAQGAWLWNDAYKVVSEWKRKKAAFQEACAGKTQKGRLEKLRRISNTIPNP